ncbi:unannotated protein [freshwater metagenome]|uniref:Unannotated protein n=1 Tax=freshwater metagenome TaxID=449393 RepID=A0A6J7IKV1_9ZZZZ|nr:hypothetical protein [Actinomycetota bacterium]
MRLDRHSEARHDGDPRILLPGAPTGLPDVVPGVAAARIAPPPAPVPTLERPRVAALLTAAAARPLTTVVAPAGAGRTVALAAWAAAADVPCAWLSLDEGDDEPRRLWAHLLAALERIRPGATRAAARALWTDADLERRVVPLTADAFARAAGIPAGARPPVDGGSRAPGRSGVPAALVLVLDDAHRLRSPAAWRLLRGLLDQAPPALRVVVSGRTAPPLRTVRRRAAGQLAAIGPDDLAFTRAETAAFLVGLHGLRLEEPWVGAAHARTAGWPAGLALLAGATPRDPGRSRFLEALDDADRSTAGYVEEEILETVSPALRQVLVRASVLGRPTGPLCAAVLDDPVAAGLLVEAREAGLLRRDGTEERWRAPFGDALRRILEAREPVEAAALHARAVVACVAVGRVGEAIAHATAAGDPDRAAGLGDAHVRALGGAPPPGGGDRSGTDAAVPWPWDGRVADAVEAGRRALAGAEDPSPTVRATTAVALGQALWLAGDAAGALAALEPRVGAMAHPSPRSWALAVLALAAGEEDPERAGRLARHAQRLAGRTGALWLDGVLTHQALADALRRRARHAEARVALDHAGELTASRPEGLHHATTLVLRAELDLAVRDRRGAAQALAEARAVLDLHPGATGLVDRAARLHGTLDRRPDVLRGSAPTPAEQRLLRLLPSELSRREIGAELFVSVDTVKTHLRRLYRRLGVETRAEAVAVARERGLLPPAG